MTPSTPSVDSRSVGSPERFLTLAALEHGLSALPAAPQSSGRVALLVRKGNGGQRETPASAHLEPSTGMPGDAWGRASNPDPDAQLAVMQRDVAELIANGQPLTLFGDNLFLDLDLSSAALPIGSRIRIGNAILTVTPMPHNGCRKFRGRFGGDALRFVSKPELRPRNLRGIYLRVLQAGAVCVGDPVELLAPH
jgi:MOSC domain-containing protein YiiM